MLCGGHEGLEERQHDSRKSAKVRWVPPTKPTNRSAARTPFFTTCIEDFLLPKIIETESNRPSGIKEQRSEQENRVVLPGRLMAVDGVTAQKS
jgi:hypothetical protein